MTTVEKSQGLINFALQGMGGRTEPRRSEGKESNFIWLSSILDISRSDASSVFPITAV